MDWPMSSFDLSFAISLFISRIPRDVLNITMESARFGIGADTGNAYGVQIDAKLPKAAMGARERAWTCLGLCHFRAWRTGDSLLHLTQQSELEHV